MQGKRNLPPFKRVPLEEVSSCTAKRSSAGPSVDALRARPDIGEGTASANSPYYTERDLRPDWLAVLVMCGENGDGKAGIMKELGITKAQLETLLSTSPAFAEGYERACIAAEAHWDSIGHDLATGDLRGAAAVYVATMANRYGWNTAKSTNTLQQSTEAKVTLVDGGEALKEKGINSELLDLLKGALED